MASYLDIILYFFFCFFGLGQFFLPVFVINLKSKFKEYFFQDRLNCFLLLYFLLPFVLYELIPTKLPHYVLPSYVALSILISKEIINNKFNIKLLNYAFFPGIILPLTILVVITLALNEYSSFDNLFFYIVSILLVLLFILIYFLKKKNIKIDFIYLNYTPNFCIFSSRILSSSTS